MDEKSKMLWKYAHCLWKIKKSQAKISIIAACHLTIHNETNFSSLYVSGASTLLSSLNIVGNIIDSGTAFPNVNYNAYSNQMELQWLRDTGTQ
jgi:hypothetical protein